MEKNEVKAKVAEALSQSDVGKSIVRLDPKLMEKLGVREGDVIEIEGKKVTGAIVRPSETDVGLNVIRMDGYIRKNAGASIGDEVKIRKAEVKEAEKVVLAPIDQHVMVRGDVRSAFINRILTKGDIIVSSLRPSISGLGGGFFEEIFKEMMDLSPLGEIRFAVVSTKPPGIVRVTDTTDVEIQSKPVDVSEIEGIKSLTDVTYEDIGGMKEAIQKVREMIEIPLKNPELFERLGIEPPKGVLLHGPPGTGKTLLAKAVANESDAHFIAINGPEIMSKYVGGSEERLREIFKEAEENAPSIIFIDEIDAIAPKREEVTGEVERRIVAQLLTLMDGLKARGQVIVIGATNRPDALDPALRRPGRFDREIEIGVPDRDERKEILEIHTRGMPLADDVDLDELADVTHGFVGADLEALCKEAAMRVLRRILPKIKGKEKVPREVLKEMVVTREDFKNALKEIQPSALREVTVQVPNVTWDDVGGLEDVKQELRETVEWPLKYPEKFKKFGIKPPKGVLLYGPPGTGKTLLAKAVANESGANFIAIKGPELLSKWVGESEKGVREVFRKARQTAPTIVFFDEIDAIASTRTGISADSGVTQRVVNQLLTEIDGLEELEDVVVLAATNRPDIIDPALLRPGRFDRQIKIGKPDKETRLKIFKVHTRNMPLADDVDLEKLAEMTEGFVGADIEAVCREAALMTLRENLDAEEVPMKNFKKAIEKIKPQKKAREEQIQYR
ncbi:AAA family ATPase, CDC48 subfamily [Methanothermus fervidus DSM 2088]|uniref:AAA family ATPase, CDC48 subfamily n=1 Tax=Methanothermus fervidus (strain ATCC 43054 / DSM 2088 / JCM 10308 / V24 S) TaxID=523846 RepID=E3GW02_METFV|nr:CDC48 family AAA ATPase [Methanothermus fervidus]ADP77767.1 AAA family ATPase, CDC48 subfamily [Methanothermus fervidus DSM 2088]